MKGGQTSKVVISCGRLLKTRKGKKPKRTPTKKVASSHASPQATDKSNSVPVPLVESALPQTPKRQRGKRGQIPAEPLTSTPVHSSSTDILPDISESSSEAKQVELENPQLCTHFEQTSEINSLRCRSKYESRLRGYNASQPMQTRKRVRLKQSGSDSIGSPAKLRPGRTRKCKATNLQKGRATKPTVHSRPRFELERFNAAEKEEDESLLSSDLSIELSHHEHQMLPLSFQEDQESEEEEEELPSFLMQGDKKPPSITEGVFVWHKFRNYPFWPALVKSVNRKQQKASIIFIEVPLIQKNKGFTVSLKTLKPFDCKEADELVCKAKEKYAAVIEWSLELITDYRIRIACGSFSGSFIEFFAHNMSYPVRRKYPYAASERLTIASDPMFEAQCDDDKEDSFCEQHEKVIRSSKRLLPDRSLAAHNRANEKLVHFIVKQRMVEGRLLAVIRGQQQSRWLRSFLSASRRRVVNVYLEDEKQLDQVYMYLNELYATAVTTHPCLAEVKSMEIHGEIPFVLDVLLPEAIIYAIAGVDKVSVKKAEEKYLRGRCVSNRERQEFDQMIDRQMQKKSQNQNSPLSLLSDVTS